MSPAAFHFAILRSAALLVPEAQRTDWLAEWRSELWHLRRDPHGASATAFCMGAFRDAFFLWRDGPILPSPGILRLNLPVTPAGIEDYPDSGVEALSSPSHCLWFLALLAALCLAVALLLPTARHALFYFPFPGNLVLLSPAGEDNPSISRQRFEALRTQYRDRFTGLAFYTVERLPVGTPHGKRSLAVASTTADLFRLLDIPVDPEKSQFVLTGAAQSKWHLPGNVDAWRIADQPAVSALPPSAAGFVVGRLQTWYTSLPDNQYQLVRLQEHSFAFLRLLAIVLFTGMSLGMVTSEFPSRHARKIGPRRALFLIAKTLLVMPVVLLGSLDLASLGAEVSPLVMHLAFFGGLFAARWILADQRRRCPVCLRLLANPVRVGEASRILLEWHGTELMCLRGHGLLYVPEWPAIWSGRQRWMDLGPSWGGLFP